MPRGPKLALLTLTDEQRDQLNGIAHSTTMPHALVQRAPLVSHISGPRQRQLGARGGR